MARGKTSTDAKKRNPAPERVVDEDDAPDDEDDDGYLTHRDDDGSPNEGVAFWTHDTCVKFLKWLPEHLGVRPERFAEACGGEITGLQLLAAARSTREMRDSLGLTSPDKRVFFERALAEVDGQGWSTDEDGEDGRFDEDESDASDASSEDEEGPSRTLPAQVPTSATALAALAALDAPPPGAQGGLFSPSWLEATSKCFDAHMGAENLGTALYALCRFVKPENVLEVGGGYTSVFILQALADNHHEIHRLFAAGAGKDGGMQPQVKGMAPGVDWHVGSEVRRLVNRRPATLHCMDDLSHAYSTAGEVRRVSKRLNIDQHLRLHLKDAWEGPPEMCANRREPVDLLWVDFGVGGRLEEFLRLYWRCVAPGGLVVIHSTLTNKVTREWLERVRRGEVDFDTFDGTGKKRKNGHVEAGGGGSVHHISLLEPHKRYQNAFTILQKRPGGWAEPLYTEEA